MRYKVKLLLLLLLIVFLSFVTHNALYEYTQLGSAAKQFQFSLVSLYLFFGISSFLLLAILALLPQRLQDNFGFVFIGLTLLKMAIAYWFFYVVTASSAGVNGLEKRQVFMVFAWFLAIETYLSSRILNNTQ